MINSQFENIKRNKSMLNVILFFSLFLNTQLSYSQAGIYDETDIEFQTMFIEAQLEKVKGNTDKQISLLKNVLKRDKSSHAAYFELAKAYEGLEEYESAEKNAKKAHQFDITNSYYLELLADIYEKTEQLKQANNTYKQLIFLNPNNFEYHDKMAFNQIVIGEPKSAIATLENWQTQKGISGMVSLKIFDIYNGLGEKDKALAVIDKLTNEFPSDTQYLTKKANYLFFIGEKDLALNVCKKILEIDPQDQTALLALAQQKIKSSPRNSNLSNLSLLMDNKSISIDAKIKELIPYMAKMPLSDEENLILKKISKNLIKSYPDEAKSYAVRGDILFYLGEFDESEKAYKKAVQLDDTKYLVWDQWILNLWELEDYKKMEKVSLDAIDFFPNKVNAYLYHAIALKQNKKIDQAVKMLEEASFISGENPNLLPLINITTNWINLDNLTTDQITKSVSEINEGQITNAIHFELLGDIYKHILEIAKSKSYWESAIKFGANSIRINKKMGV